MKNRAQEKALTTKHFGNITDIDSLGEYVIPQNGVILAVAEQIVPRNWNIFTNVHAMKSSDSTLNIHVKIHRHYCFGKSDWGVDMQHAGQNYLILNLYKPKIWLNALLEALAFIRLQQWVRSTLRAECLPNELRFRGRCIPLTQEGMDTLWDEFRAYGEIFTHCYALFADALCKQFCPANHHEKLGFCPYTITCAYYPLYFYHPETEEFLQDWEIERCLAYADFDVEDEPLPSKQEHSIECETTMS